MLFTDYTNIALVWNCKNLPENKYKENFWVLSRVPVMERKEDIDFVQNIIDEFMDESQVRPTIQGEK